MYSRMPTSRFPYPLIGGPELRKKSASSDVREDTGWASRGSNFFIGTLAEALAVDRLRGGPALLMEPYLSYPAGIVTWIGTWPLPLPLERPLKEAKALRHVIYNVEAEYDEDLLKKLKEEHSEVSFHSFDELLCCLYWTFSSFVHNSTEDLTEKQLPQGVLDKNKNTSGRVYPRSYLGEAPKTKHGLTRHDPADLMM